VVDYEHQTLLAAQNGHPAPAAGWFSKLEWRESGLFAIDVEWTERATQMIEGGEYKYISPVFAYDKKTGKVLRLLHAALTNNPALDGMDAVAASQYQLLNTEKLSMNELLEQLRWLRNMPVTVDEVVTELQKAIDQLKGSNPAIVTKADFNLVARVQTSTAKLPPSKRLPIIPIPPNLCRSPP
jgi:phage I-like protein